MLIQIWTDGSVNRSRGNLCSWAFLCKIDEEFFCEQYDEITSEHRTGNISEMTGITKALEFINHLLDESGVDRYSCDIVVYSDSQYCVNGITKWIHQWRTINFQKTKNVDYWKHMYELVYNRRYRSIDFVWIRGHSGVPENERVDKLCKLITVRK
jgi:ribonuclease HI